MIPRMWLILLLALALFGTACGEIGGNETTFVDEPVLVDRQSHGKSERLFPMSYDKSRCVGMTWAITPDAQLALVGRVQLATNDVDSLEQIEIEFRQGSQRVTEQIKLRQSGAGLYRFFVLIGEDVQSLQGSQVDVGTELQFGGSSRAQEECSFDFSLNARPDSVLRDSGFCDNEATIAQLTTGARISMTFASRGTLWYSRHGTIEDQVRSATITSGALPYGSSYESGTWYVVLSEEDSSGRVVSSVRSVTTMGLNNLWPRDKIHWRAQCTEMR